MQLGLVVLAAVVVASSAYPTVLLQAPVPIAAVLPAGLKSQYHAQDELGQYTYGYSDGLSAKSEAKTVDGVTRGAYSYVDSTGIVQNVNYISDAAGFRVAASNLPIAPAAAPPALLVAPAPIQDTPEVAAAKAAHLNALNEEAVKSAAAPEEAVEESNDGADESTAAPEAAPAAEPASAPASSASPASPSEPLAAAAPAAQPLPALAAAPAAAPLALAPTPLLYAAAPIVAAPVPIVAAPAPIVAAPATVLAAPAPIVAGPIASQYHSQDELGQYSYGYAGGPSSKAELKTFDGITRGGYSYLDANGLIQSANYISDPVNGFRVAASNLPVAPAPVDIPDSPEVAEAKAKHLALSAKAAAEAAQNPE